jgi:hypothetical protein
MKVKNYQSVLSLKPTQFSIGIIEVEFKVLEMQKLSPKKLQKLVDSKPIPVVISPWGQLCITDHHHFLFACWHANVKKVRIEVVQDWSKLKLSYHQFWKKMQKRQLAYLYDQFGEGPRSPLYLPMDIRGVADDPYRSLAWMIRKEGGFENSDTNFAEFKWANFFRERRMLESHGRDGLQQAIKKGLRLLKRKNVLNLPGAISAEKIETDLHLNPKKLSKFVPKAKKNGPLGTKPI